MYNSIPVCNLHVVSAKHCRGRHNETRSKASDDVRRCQNRFWAGFDQVWSGLVRILSIYTRVPTEIVIRIIVLWCLTELCPKILSILQNRIKSVMAFSKLFSKFSLYKTTPPLPSNDLKVKAKVYPLSDIFFNFGANG